MIKLKKWMPLFTTQFLGVLNDNVLKNAIIFIGIFWLAKEDQELVIPIASALLVFPFVLFSPLAGRWSQTKSKQKILELSKLAEIPIMLTAVFGFFSQSMVVVMAAMLLMGVQSALYSPSKYGLIRDVGGVEGVSFGIGTMELLTFVGVLIGQVVTGFISDLSTGSVWFASALMLFLAIVGWMTSRKITVKEPAPTINVRDTANPVKFIYQSYTWSKSTKGLNYTVLGLGSFWLVASMLQMNIYLHAPGHYGMSNTQTSVVMALIAVGIGLGCWVAGLIAKDKVEIGMVPLGGIALSICMTLFATVDLSPTSFVILLFIAAFFSGFYKVPLNAWLQQRVKGRKLGNILAYNNMVAFLFILISAGIFGLITMLFNTGTVFLVIALISWIMTAITILNIPSMMIKFIAGSLARFYFNMEVHGSEHLPMKTGGLLISNHRSLIDPFIISAATTRMVRFVMAREIYENPMIHWLVKRLNVIPVSAKLGKEQLEEFTRTCQEEINKGHLVCIFPEGQISRIGHLLEFKKGIEFIAEGIQAPIIPIYLDGLEGIPLSFEVGSSKPILRFHSFKKRIYANIGEGILDHQTAFHLRGRVEELRAEALAKRIENHRIDEYFSKIAKGNTTTAFIDPGGAHLSYRELHEKSMRLSRYLNGEFQHVKTMGIVARQQKDVFILLLALVRAGIASILVEPGWRKINSASLLEGCDLVITEKNLGADFSFRNKHYLLQDILTQSAKHVEISRYNGANSLTPKKHPFVMTTIEQNEAGQEVEVHLSHQNILAAIHGLTQIFDQTQGRRVLSTIPFHTAYGYSLNLWLPLLTGMMIVQTPHPNDFGDLAERIISERVEILFANRHTVQALFKMEDSSVWGTIETIITGQQAVEEHIQEILYRDFNVNLLQSIGFTAFGSVIAVNSPNFTLKDISGNPIRQHGSKSNTFGRPIPGVAVKILSSSQQGQELGVNEHGLIQVKGASLCHSDCGHKGSTINWRNTGFIGSVDQDGFLNVENRATSKQSV